MPTRVLRSIKGRTIRATRLDACGVPDPTCGTVVSNGFISVRVSNETVTGRDYESRDIWGNLCISDTDPDDIVAASVEVNLCGVNPDLLYILTGQEPVRFDGQAIGFRESASRNWAAYSLEVWTKALSDCDEWGYLVIPYIRNGRLSGEVTIENGPVTTSTVGMAYPATGWGDGPYIPNPFRVPFVDGDIYGMVVTDVPPPAEVDLSYCPEVLIDGARFRIDAAESETLNA